MMATWFRFVKELPISIEDGRAMLGLHIGFLIVLVFQSWRALAHALRFTTSADHSSCTYPSEPYALVSKIGGPKTGPSPP